MSGPESPANHVPAVTFPRFLTVGFVGSRRLSAQDGPDEDLVSQVKVRQRIDEILAGLQDELRPGESLAAVSALAAGADTIFGQAVAARKIVHQVFLPQTPDVFFDTKDFFGSPDRLARAKDLLKGDNVIETRLVSDSPDRDMRFSECGYQIVLESDVLIAILPEKVEVKRGGTRETLQYAESHGRRIFDQSGASTLFPIFVVRPPSYLS